MATAQIVIDLDAKPAVGEFDAFQQKFTAGMQRLKDSASIGFNHVQSTSERLTAAFRTLGSDTLAMSDRFAALTRPIGMARDALESAGVSTGLLGRALGFLTSPLGLIVGTLTSLVAIAITATHAMDENARAVRAMMAVSGQGAEEADNLVNTMKLLGLESGSVTTALFRLSAQIDSGGVALNRLGISIFANNGALKTEGDLFLEIRDRLSEMGTAAQRNAALIDIFGRSGRDLATVFAMNSDEFRRWQRLAAEVAPWSETLQKQATEHSRAVAFLGAAWDGLLTRIGAVTSPILTFVTNMTTGAVRWLSAFVDGITGLGRAINAISLSSFERIFQALGDFARVFAQEGFLTAVGTFWKTLVEGNEAASKAVTDSADKTAKAMQIPFAIAGAMEKERIDARLKEHQKLIELIGIYDEGRLKRQDITEEQSVLLQIGAIGKQREAQTTWFDEQKALLAANGDQFGQQMQSLTVKHNEAMTTLHQQEEKLWTDLKVFRFKDSKDLLDRLLETAGKGAETVSGLVDGQTGAVLKAYTVQLAGVGAYYESLLRDETLSAEDRQRIQNGYFTAIRAAQADYFGKKHDAEQQDRLREVQRLKDSQRDEGDWFGFMASGFRAAALQIGDFWDISNRLAVNTFQSMRSGLSDFFFQLEEGTLNGKKLFESFLGSLKRAVADFFADATIRLFFGGGSGAGGGGGGGGLLGGLLFGTGTAAANTLTGGSTGGGGGGGLLGGLLSAVGLGNFANNASGGGLFGALGSGVTNVLDRLTGGGFSDLLNTIRGTNIPTPGGQIPTGELPSGDFSMPPISVGDIPGPVAPGGLEGGATVPDVTGGDFSGSLTNFAGLGETASGTSGGFDFSSLSSLASLAGLALGLTGSDTGAHFAGAATSALGAAGLEAASGTTLATTAGSASLFFGAFAGKGIGQVLSAWFGPSLSQAEPGRSVDRRNLLAAVNMAGEQIGGARTVGELQAAVNLLGMVGLTNIGTLTAPHFQFLDDNDASMMARVNQMVQAQLALIAMVQTNPTTALANPQIAAAWQRVQDTHARADLVNNAGWQRYVSESNAGRPLVGVQGAQGLPEGGGIPGQIDPNDWAIKAMYYRQYYGPTSAMLSGQPYPGYNPAFFDLLHPEQAAAFHAEQTLANLIANAPTEGAGFQHGGVVPGWEGQPQWALVHGGERVLTPEQQREGPREIRVFVEFNSGGDPFMEAMEKGCRVYARAGRKMIPAEIVYGKSGT